MKIENFNNFNKETVDNSRKKAFAFMDAMALQFENVKKITNSNEVKNSNEVNEFSKIIKEGGKINIANDTLYFSNLNKIKNNINNNKTITNSVEVVSGGLDPVFNYFANQTNIEIELQQRLFGLSYGANGSTKEVEIEDFITKSTTKAGANPFSKTSIGYEINKNSIVLGEDSDYYTENLTSALSIVRKPLNFGNKQALIGINQRQGFYLDRNFMNELGYQVVKSEDLINVAIKNIAPEIKIRKMRNLVYKQLFNSNKFTTAGDQYNKLKSILYVNANNPVSLGQQTDQQFIETCNKLKAHISVMKNNGANNSPIILGLDTETINDLNRVLFFEINNGSGLLGLSNIQLSQNPTRLNYLLSTGIEIIEIMGAVKDKFNTYFNDCIEITNNRVNYLWVKKLFQYVDLLDTSIISNGSVISGLSGLNNFNNYTMNSPIDGSVFVLTTHSPVFEGTAKYYDDACLYAAKFDI